MDWILSNPQIDSMFASLGSMDGDKYVISEQCIVILEEINCKLLMEDHTLRTFRRAIQYGENIKRYLMPLLINGKVASVIDAVIRILVNLTVPIECLVSIEIMSKSEAGRLTIFDLNKLLAASKEAFTEFRSTKSIIDYMKSILEKDSELSFEQCDSVNNCLLLLRNILHIPEITSYNNHGNAKVSMQNQIVWNLFTQSIDKLLVYLMSFSQKTYWGITMVQLIALMYKDQHVSTLQKLLNIWFEASLSDSSDDNESNTTPPKQCSGGSSPMLMSDPTSDSSDTGGSVNHSTEGQMRGLSAGEIDSDSSKMSLDFVTPNLKVNSPTNHRSSKDREHIQPQKMITINTPHQNIAGSCNQKERKRESFSSQSEMSDCGYGTQVENQESISTSSNEDDCPKTKPIHHPPCNQKQRFNAASKHRNSCSIIQDQKEWRRKKIVKRSRSNFKTKNKKLDFEANFDSNRINMKGLLHHTPTNDDISNILKEFTVDFLLKGYGCLVKDLHAQLLSDMNKVQIDTSHFFWLITYFLKFAAQLELELEHLTFVLSYEVISYLTFEGVNLCEELEIASLQQGSDLSSCLRRMHLVVTAIREFLQALDTYQKITHLNEKDKNYLKFLQYQIGATEDLKSLFNLLLKRYNPSFQSKQYLQDLIVTNHILLLHLDGVVKLHEYKGITMVDHLKQFATVEIMHQYGFLLVDFQENGEFVNDCIFNMMHHVGGDLGQISTLFQPVILKTFSKIWEIEYQLCDDWSDLIEYVINKFINKTQQRPMFNIADEPRSPCKIQIEPNPWTKQQMDCLYWYYVQGKRSKDVIGQIMKQLNDNGQGHKTRIAVIQRLLQQDIVSLLEYDKLMKAEDPSFDRLVKSPTPSISTVESGINMKHSLLLSDNNKPIDDIQFLRDRLLKENKGNLINWIQRVLVECVYVKLNINNNNNNSNNNNNNYNINNKHSSENLNIMEPVAHHFIIKKQSIPIVPWNAEQSNILVYQPFILLLHKLGFHLPADTGKLFVRIPDFWTADILYSVALKLGPIDKSILKFDENQFLQCKERVLAAPNNINISNVPLVTTDYLSNSKSKTSNSIIRFTPDPALPPSVPNWLNVVMKSRKIQVKSLQQLLPTNPTNTMNLIQPTLISNSEEHETLSNCETASVASDLIRMYVSDEETN